MDKIVVVPYSGHGVYIIFINFWGPFVKRFALCYQTVV